MYENQVKYLTTSEEDNNWGLYINVAGSVKIGPTENYPSRNHPSEYFFNWEEGRVLKEFQINYITEGEGILENTNGTFPLKKGSVFITFPGVWHRYKPLTKTGWTENYIGFNGELARKLIAQPQFDPKNPVFNFGIKEELIDTYLKIFDLVEKEQPGYQQIASGMIIKLLGYIISFEKQKGFSGKTIAKVIEVIRFEMRQNIEKVFDLKAMAQNHHVSYSYFRKMFKKYTGVSPGQYHLQLRIMRAKELLISTDKSIKEISYELGFQSIFYFSNMFKKKEGTTPSHFRNKNRME
ncbi:MAG: AraC family transcriptional regulator [Bacteroidetes bacterium]|nr:AraC family transcriptional regulator [Bacteroidota bacterium]